MRVPLVGDERRRARAVHGPRGVGQRMDPGQRAVELSAVRARDLHHQGKPHLRPGARRRRAGGRRYESRVLPPRLVAEPSRARRAVRAVRPLLRERRGEPRRPQLVDGRVRHRLPREDGAVQLLGARPLVRLRGREPRQDSGRRRRRAGERLPLEPRGDRRASRSATTASTWFARGRVDPDDPPQPGYRGNKPFLRAHTNPLVSRVRPRDSRPASRRRLARGVEASSRRRGSMPTLEIVRLPNDHTSGATAGRPRRAPPSPTTISRSGA